ncbi:cell adhesion molecule 2-like [Anneissia japonica]|uniref:cell adhesion molecule 2-like n=1 Tax=Anneissia japonica TaxID=1529436 RepID=UPI0014259241|nr:cell adhesion molecule 2-like [Anneissia japonica]
MIMLIELFLLFMTYICSSNSFTGFELEPLNKKQSEGGIAYFNCMVTGLKEVEYVSWIHDGKKISENGIIIDKNVGDRYVVDGNSLLGTFHLHIQNIQRKDDGQFVCTVFKNGDQLVAQSQPANLTVLQVPRQHYPICSAISASYIAGTNIDFTCRSEITDPPVQLKWKRNSVDVTSQVEANIGADYIVSYSIVASENDKGSIFTCELTTSANSAIQRNCTSGPINILYAPHVRIKQTDLVVLGKEAIFICYSDSNPAEVKFEWVFNPPLDESVYTLENERILRISNIKAFLNGSFVECKVTNSIGSQSHILRIDIYNSYSETVKIPSKKERVKSGNEENNIETENDKTKSKHERPQSIAPGGTKNKQENFSISLIVAIAVACIVIILGLALIPVGYMRYTRRQPGDTVSRGRPVSIPEVYFEPKDHVDAMLPQVGLGAPWMRTVGVQVPGECEYDVTYTQDFT